ncbi:MAG: TRAP transporter large permease subunit [Chloroflexaceae bacterium]|nr:TRAP transporter large permease subunit [Chloroflexaceae bacterium]
MPLFSQVVFTEPYEWLGLVMFLTLIVFLGSGYPVAFSIAGVGIVFGAIGIWLDLFPINLLNALPSRMFTTMGNFTLLAIPYFIFMGAMLEQSGLAEDLLETMGILFGPIRGGLAIAIVVVGTMLAATTGVVAATVVAMSLISLPIMLRYGYSKELTCGVICAAGTLGQIIPPSVVLVVLGAQLGVSIGDLFIGSLIPGMLLSGGFIVYCGMFAIFLPKQAPALPAEVRNIGVGELALRVLKVMIPPLVLIIAVLGSIFIGLASATEAGSVGALGATLLALFNGKLNLKTIKNVADATLRVSTMVIFILFGSTVFSLIFRGIGGDTLVTDVFLALPGDEIGFLLASMLLVFVLGFFIDFFEIAFIVLPLLVPAATILGIDLVWFGVVLGANLQTSFLTPPFGFALFYLRGIAPPDQITIGHIYRGVIPFIIIQVTLVVLIIIFPGLVTWLIEVAAAS